MPSRRWPLRQLRRRARGAVAVEYSVVLLASFALVAPAGEFLRLSLIDQTLARATHEAARAAGADPGNCEGAVRVAFEADDAARWLLDVNEDGTIGIASGDDGWPDNSPASEVQVGVAWDADLSDGVSWPGTGCGDAGSWIRVRARLSVQPWFGPLREVWADGVIRRSHESWARNQG